MRQWFVLLQKEMLEMRRNFKWIWVPLVFIILGMIDPLSTYFLPQILDAVGSLPEGAVIEMPTPTAPEVLFMSVSQFNMIGILVLILASMGLIASERRSGVAGLILVKPVHYASYITSKWAGVTILMLVSLFLGILAGWYYTQLLFEPIPFTLILQAFVITGLWLIFVLTITIFFNCLFKVSGLVAFCSLLTVIVITVLTSTFKQWLEWSPAQLTGNVGALLMEGQLLESFWVAVVLTLLSISALLFFSTLAFKNKELDA